MYANNDLLSLNYNGHNSTEFNLAIANRPPYTAPKRQVERLIVEGRHGDLMLDNGRYENVEFSILFFIIDGVDNLRNQASEIFNWLKVNFQYTQFFLSDDPHYFYLASCTSELNLFEFEELYDNGSLNVEFVRKPQRFSRIGQEVITLDKPNTIFNPETQESAPQITIFGNGNITLIVNNLTVAFNNVNDYVVIDSEFMNCFKVENGKKVSQNHLKITLEYPNFKVGKNEISWVGNVSKIEVIGRWWRL